MHGQLTEWTQDVADVLSEPPGQLQLQALAAWLKRLGFHDQLLLFIYEGCCPPLALFDTLPEVSRSLFIGEYQAGPYQLDPFYLACTFGQADGIYSMRRLAPERFYTTEFYCSYYRYLELGGKLGLIITLGEEGRAVFSLLRQRQRSPFSSEEMELLRSAVPVVEQVVRAAWAAHRPGVQSAVGDLDRKVGAAIEQFGQGVLTERECQIARLLLEGHSNMSIAQQLQVSAGTVKAHCHNLYGKLEVSSQSQLLALFVRELKRA